MFSITKKDGDSTCSCCISSADLGDSGVYWFSKMMGKFLDDLLVTEI